MQITLEIPDYDASREGTEERTTANLSKLDLRLLLRERFSEGKSSKYPFANMTGRQWLTVYLPSPHCPSSSRWRASSHGCLLEHTALFGHGALGALR